VHASVCPAKVCRRGPCPKTQDVYAAGHRVHSLGRKVNQVARPSWSRTIRLTPFCIELADGHTAEAHLICGGGPEEAGRLAVVAEPASSQGLQREDCPHRPFGEDPLAVARQRGAVLKRGAVDCPCKLPNDLGTD
jgi:hypothetical protein